MTGTTPILVALLTPVVSALVGAVVGLLMQHRSNRYWVAQERWRFKADHYSRLLQNIAEQERLSIWFAYEENTPSVREQPMIQATHKRYGERLRELSSELTRLRAVAGVWLSDYALKALDDLEKDEEENTKAGSYTLAAKPRSCSQNRAECSQNRSF